MKFLGHRQIFQSVPFERFNNSSASFKKIGTRRLYEKFGTQNDGFDWIPMFLVKLTDIVNKTASIVVQVDLSTEFDICGKCQHVRLK